MSQQYEATRAWHSRARGFSEEEPSEKVSLAPPHSAALCGHEANNRVSTASGMQGRVRTPKPCRVWRGGSSKVAVARRELPHGRAEGPVLVSGGSVGQDSTTHSASAEKNGHADTLKSPSVLPDEATIPTNVDRVLSSTSKSRSSNLHLATLRPTQAFLSGGYYED